MLRSQREWWRARGPWGTAGGGAWRLSTGMQGLQSQVLVLSGSQLCSLWPFVCVQLAVLHFCYPFFFFLININSSGYFICSPRQFLFSMCSPGRPTGSPWGSRRCPHSSLRAMGWKQEPLVHGSTWAALCTPLASGGTDTAAQSHRWAPRPHSLLLPQGGRLMVFYLHRCGVAGETCS